MKTIIRNNLNIKSFVELAIQLISRASIEAIKDHGQFRMVLTGGETYKPIYRQLKNLNTDWSLWEFWISDERCVSRDSELSNELKIRGDFFDFIRAEKSQVHFMEGELGPVLGSENYKKYLDTNIIFDLTLLGIGEDGHIASLFPGNDLGSSPNAPEVMPVFNSPKPPSERISLSMRRLNKSSVILILASGVNKKKVVNNFENGLEMPALHIRGIQATYLLYCPVPGI